MYKIIPLRNNPFGRSDTPISIVMYPRDEDNNFYDLLNVERVIYDKNQQVFNYSYLYDFSVLPHIEKMAIFMASAVADLMVMGDYHFGINKTEYDFGYDGDHSSYEFTEDEIDIFASVFNERMLRYNEWCDNYHDIIQRIINRGLIPGYVKRILLKVDDMMEMFLAYGMSYYIRTIIDRIKVNSFSFNDIDLSIDAKDNSTWIFDAVVNSDVF